MPPSGPPTEREIRTIARRTTNIIETHITSDVCVFGSAACALWADIERTPNDIDILVSSEDEEFDPEDIKETIANQDDRYFLRPSSKPGATYNKLYCRLPGWTIEDRCVKVDILVAPTGKLKLPDILSSDIEIINDIPVMPIFALLVLKTQGWRDHRKSPRADLRAKEDDDVFDICALLERAEEENVSYDEEAYNYSQQFMDRALGLAKKFISFHGTSHQWRALDFPV